MSFAGAVLLRFFFSPVKCVCHNIFFFQVKTLWCLLLSVNFTYFSFASESVCFFQVLKDICRHFKMPTTQIKILKAFLNSRIFLLLSVSVSYCAVQWIQNRLLISFLPLWIIFETRKMKKKNVPAAVINSHQNYEHEIFTWIILRINAIEFNWN